MLDLQQSQLDRVRAILHCHVPECEVRAFGSRVKGKAKPYSDLDLVLVGGSEVPSKQLAELTEAFQASDLPIRVDVLDWQRISPEFRRLIAENYVVVQTAAE